MSSGFEKDVPKETHSSPGIEIQERITQLQNELETCEANAKELDTAIAQAESFGETGEDVKGDLEIQKRFNDERMPQIRKKLETLRKQLPRSMN